MNFLGEPSGGWMLRLFDVILIRRQTGGKFGKILDTMFISVTRMWRVIQSHTYQVYLVTNCYGIPSHPLG